MIRAGRRHLVRTLDDLAKLEGISKGRYLTKKLHKRPGHPLPINGSAGATTKQIYDAEQVEAYRANAPVPPLPDSDQDDDLLDRTEAPTILKRPVSPTSWDSYKRDPLLTSHVQVIGGIEHWPRHIVLAWDAARPGPGSGGGRPPRTGDLIPRELIHPRTAALLDHDPAVTAEAVADELGVHPDTATRALVSARADRVRDLLLADEPDPTPEEISRRLGFPLRTARTALATAQAQQRAAAAAHYVEPVAEALDDAFGVTDFPGILVRPGAVCAAILTLATGAPTGLLVWDERYGWRTATARPSTVRGEATPPTGNRIGYLTHSITPAPDTLISALRDRRTWARRPRTNTAAQSPSHAGN
ncbi:hypothetical protein [Streptomyces sp. NPDC037389]|uniref:hypothetical protein n=1 Tax=Streptomyces sp. NPDC037389 TaxID=3155369 RepID=UPI0033CD88D0